MRSIEDKDISNGGSHPRTALGSKPTPSKWDDAQKWLVGFSRGGDRNPHKTKPRNSNADDTRLIAPLENDYSSGDYDDYEVAMTENLGLSVCVRDMGTEMTSIASQELSRTTTPIRARTPVGQIPIYPGASNPTRCPRDGQSIENNQIASPLGRQSGSIILSNEEQERANNRNRTVKISPLETQAMAWDEAERAKYMARYKREEVKIQAWENHQKRKAEMEMKKLEVKAERLKARAQEKSSNKLTATRRITEEKLANAEVKLNGKAVETSEKADYIRRTGHFPSSLSFKLPSCCWQ